jgi:hypothetical protein
MLRNKPAFNYCGLTIVLSNPSRFDVKSNNLLSANGGQYLNEQCLRPAYNIHQCDIRVKEDTSELLPGTKCVLLLGEDAAKQWLQNTDNTLNEIRGSVYYKNEIPHIASYYPQDACDIKDYESTNNPLHQSENANEETEDEESGGGVSEKRHHGKTKRKNFAFWLKKDVEKCRYLLTHNGKIPEPSFIPEYVIYPSLQHAVDVLIKTKNEHFYFDIETDSVLHITCFSFNFSNSKQIFSIPVILHDYSWAYSNLPVIFRALTIAFRDNTTVAHNGSGFDFLIMPWKYGVPLGNRLYDTMLAHHRCFPEVEKSLGHGISLWLWEQFHKDEGGGGYNNIEQCRKMWKYCGKDVYTMRLMHEQITAYAKRRPGLEESIAAANATIKPYLTMTLTGIRYKQEMLKDIMHENDRLMMCYMKIINFLIGENAVAELKKMSKKSMPGSNAQCCKYFHDMLGYAVVAKGKEKKDGTRGASLNKKAMYRLRLKYENPVIDLVIAFRMLQKESGSLKFNPWKETDNLTI